MDPERLIAAAGLPGAQGVLLEAKPCPPPSPSVPILHVNWHAVQLTAYEVVIDLGVKFRERADEEITTRLACSWDFAAGLGFQLVEMMEGTKRGRLEVLRRMAAQLERELAENPGQESG